MNNRKAKIKNAIETSDVFVACLSNNSVDKDGFVQREIEFALERQERRWEDEVGIKPADSHFTLIVPIYNEEEALPSFLNSLLLSDIPASINMNMIFITNF